MGTFDYAPFFRGHNAAFVLLDDTTGRYERLNPDACARRLAPCSTFKIPNSLISLETGAATGPDMRLRWDGVRRPIPDWNRDLTLREAFAVSAVWYFQTLATRVGERRMREWVRRLHYGNEDTSGGLTRFWLQTSLLISADEQVEFLRRFAAGELPFSKRTQDAVRGIMVWKRAGGVVLRGKTGTGGDLKADHANLGWFVGWAEGKARRHIFAANIQGGENPSGRTVRRLVVRALTAKGVLPPGLES